jgi:hypothetical protein
MKVVCTHCAELGVLGVDGECATQSLIARLFPLSDECGINKLVVNTVAVNLFANAVECVIKVVNVPGLLPVDLVNRPAGLYLSHALVGRVNLVCECM